MKTIDKNYDKTRAENQRGSWSDCQSRWKWCWQYRKTDKFNKIFMKCN